MPPVRFLPFLLMMLAVGGCAGTLTSRLTLPERNTLVRDQLVIHSDFPLSAHHRLFEQLTAQRTELCTRLALPSSDEPIEIYLFDSAERFQGFMRLHHPDFPDRRAFFVETDSQLSVYGQWGDRMADDLRHEVTHGYLHSVVPNIPQWIDEGIAKYFEVSRGQRGVNRPLLDRLLVQVSREHWQPNLRRLEKFPVAYDMTHDDYAEAWAWVHFFMESRPEYLDILRGYLDDLRRSGNAMPLSSRLAARISQPETPMIEHIRQLGRDEQ
jgi:hypothetical protein